MGNRDTRKREAKKPKKKEPKAVPARRDAGQLTVQNVKPAPDAK
jgi:hypothetical protein